MVTDNKGKKEKNIQNDELQQIIILSMIMLSKFQCVTGNRKSKNLHYFVVNQRQLLKHNKKICRKSDMQMIPL